MEKQTKKYNKTLVNKKRENYEDYVIMMKIMKFQFRVQINIITQLILMKQQMKLL